MNSKNKTNNTSVRVLFLLNWCISDVATMHMYMCALQELACFLSLFIKKGCMYYAYPVSYGAIHTEVSFHKICTNEAIPSLYSTNRGWHAIVKFWKQMENAFLIFVLCKDTCKNVFHSRYIISTKQTAFILRRECLS